MKDFVRLNYLFFYFMEFDEQRFAEHLVPEWLLSNDFLQNTSPTTGYMLMLFCMVFIRT